MSGLKEYAFLFVHPFIQDGKLWDGQEIRKSLGNFEKIQNQPALLAARWSQAFSGSHPSVTLQRESIQHILDRRAEDGSLFTDGVGKISPALAREVNVALQQQRQIPKRSKKPPSAYQFRIGGAKGVVVVDPTLKGRVICLRKSQVKFEGNSLSLDISNTSARPIAVYLNRALIVLLEHHGVSTEYIKVLQRRAVDEVQTIIQGLGRASVILRHHGLGTSFRVPSLLKSIHSTLGLDISIQHRSGLDHQLIITSLHYALTHILGEIKHRAHIHVPGSHTLIGVADEWDCLEEGEIFATVTDRTKGRTEIVGDVLITRSPQIHPGDVRMVRAVRRPQLEHLTNVVVFSCRGSRSLPSMLGGGDLDGDIYNLIVDPNLHPPGGETHAPGDYQPLPRRTTPHTCTLTDVADFVIDFIKSDLVGIISNLHLRISDLDEDEGPACEDCLYLAEKASHAVDFPKTGTPVDAGELPFPRNSIRPDFLSGEGVNPTHNPRFYPSAKLLGELYRNIPDQEFHPVPGRKHITDGKTIMDALKRLDLDSIALPSLEHPTDELTEEMGDILEDYSTQLAHLAKVHSASRRASDHLSEAELVSGTIQSKWIDSHKRREAVRTMNMQTHELVTATRREIRGPMPEKPSRDAGTDDEGSVIDDLGDDGEDLDDCVDFFHDQEIHCQAFTRAFAAWRIAEESLEYDSDAFGSSSFGLLALGIMLDTVKAMMIITYGIPH
ncbi:hypothetical protein ONZ45_g10666 [Pleurotus djamor]|nr:hypothetical protein ONZ45_g10666 [Pleurotus djamor]